MIVDISTGGIPFIQQKSNRAYDAFLGAQWEYYPAFRNESPRPKGIASAHFQSHKSGSEFHVEALLLWSASLFCFTTLRWRILGGHGVSIVRLTSIIKLWQVSPVKVPLHIVQARRERLAQIIEQHRYLPVKELCRRLGVSEATLRRDLSALVQEKKITRTYGGALSEFNDRFPSFRERQSQSSRAKAKIAKAALAFFEPGRTYFFDSGTTIFAIAEAFRVLPVTPVTIVTSNLPVGEILASIPGVQVFQLAGQLLHLQSTLLGETARKSLEFWTFDVSFLSSEGMDAEGLWNSQAAIVEQQKVVMGRSGRSVFCLDSSKLKRKAPYFLLPWPQVDFLLTDTPNAKLKLAGIELDDRQISLGSARSTQDVIRVGRALMRDGFVSGAEESEGFPVHIL